MTHGTAGTMTNGGVMIQTECNGWSAYAANIFNASRQSSGSRAVDDHATDTMTGTAHMLRAVLSECVRVFSTDDKHGHGTHAVRFRSTINGSQLTD